MSFRLPGPRRDRPPKNPQKAQPVPIIEIVPGEFPVLDKFLIKKCGYQPRFNAPYQGLYGKDRTEIDEKVMRHYGRITKLVNGGRGLP